MPCKGCQRRRAAIAESAKSLSRLTGQSDRDGAQRLSAEAKAFAAQLKTKLGRKS